jgi:transcriptional regulator with XRE-family HTH domain
VTSAALRRLRRRLGLTQARLAAVVGVPANTIARWERGEMRMRPSMDRLVRLTIAEAERQRGNKPHRRS